MDKYCIVAISPVYRLIVALPISATAESKFLYLVISPNPNLKKVFRSGYLHPVVHLLVMTSVWRIPILFKISETFLVQLNALLLNEEEEDEKIQHNLWLRGTHKIVIVME